MNAASTGFKWDYEYVRAGSNALPELLDATRRALPPGTPISVAAPIWCPPLPVCWSEAYYTEVAKHCGQICVMGYDTALMFPRAYTWLISQQAIRVTHPHHPYTNHC